MRIGEIASAGAVAAAAGGLMAGAMADAPMLAAELAAPSCSTCTVERRLAARTLAMYTEALLRLQASAAGGGRGRCAQAQPHHVRSWAAQLRARGLAPRSIAIALAAWRGLYRWWGRARRGARSTRWKACARPRRPSRCPRRCRWSRRWRWPSTTAEHGDPALRGARPLPSSSCSTAAACAWANWSGWTCAAGAAAAGWVDAARRHRARAGQGQQAAQRAGGRRRRCAALQAWLALRGTLAARRRAGAVRQPARHAAHAQPGALRA